MGIESLLGVK